MRGLAYRRTLYRAGDVLLRVGRRSPSADGWMARHGTPVAGFITAWNPMSRVMAAAWNAAAQVQLRGDLRGAWIEEGEGVLGLWREEMLLAAC